MPIFNYTHIICLLLKNVNKYLIAFRGGFFQLLLLTFYEKLHIINISLYQKFLMYTSKAFDIYSITLEYSKKEVCFYGIIKPIRSAI